jgi:hypothetical protein
MITVRFPSGFSVQYNDAGFVCGPDERGIVRLYDSSDKKRFFARIPSDALVEFIRPCRTYNASGPSGELTAEVALLQKKVASLTRSINKLAKTK